MENLNFLKDFQTAKEIFTKKSEEFLREKLQANGGEIDLTEKEDEVVFYYDDMQVAVSLKLDGERVVVVGEYDNSEVSFSILSSDEQEDIVKLLINE